MVKIQNSYIDRLAEEHFSHIKNKLKDFPENRKYTLEEIIMARPEKLHEIANSFKSSKAKYKFMLNRYKSFTNVKKEYNSYDLADRLHIDVCPYCNINPTYTTVINRRGAVINKTEFSHFYDRERYPILALSFYNLIPSCQTCSLMLKKAKSVSIKSHLNPYSDSFDELVKFKIDINSSKFYYSTDGFSIDLVTEDKRAENTIKLFRLREIYQKHRGVVLELIRRKSIYSSRHLNEILDRYRGVLFKDRRDLDIAIGSGYISNREIGDYPLSKLVKDILEEL